jgi:hypothetical protein
MIQIPAVQKQGRVYRGGIAIATVFLLPLLLLAGCWRIPQRFYIEVAQYNSGAILLRQMVAPGDGFSIWFFHSYDRAPFEEHYRVIGENQILLTHMTFKSSLNGQGFVLGTYRSRGDGSAELADINQKLEQVVFRLGSPDLANHALIINGRRLRLLDYAEAGSLLCIRIKCEATLARTARYPLQVDGHVP